MVFVLVLVAFFYGSTEKAPDSLTALYATPAECVAAKEAAVARIEANSEVEGAIGVCIAVREQDKI